MACATPRLAVALVLAGALAPALAAELTPVQQVDAYPGMSEHSRMIRDGVLKIPGRPNMHPEKGRFHIVHVDEIDMECTSCHVAAGFAPDYQVVTREQALAKAAGTGKGEQADVIDRTVCLGCHKDGGIASRWYGSVGQ